MLILTAENMKKAEECAVENGKTWYSLMETAGTECARHIAKEETEKKITIICGKGRNGGDGFVIARKLWQYGYRKIFTVLTDPLPADELCIQMYEEMAKYPISICLFTENEETSLHHIATADVIVDAVFGIGFRGDLRGNAKICIEAANANIRAKKYAIDIPSGLEASGKEASVFFRADETLTMIAYKPLHVFKPYSDMCGKISVMNIGIGEEILSRFSENYFTYTKSEALGNIRKRHFADHKGTYGRILTICGSCNMTGCVYLCNQAAVEIGAGLVTAAFPDCIYNTVTSKLTEPTFMPLPTNKNGRIKTDARILTEKLSSCDVVAMGCGTGCDNDTKELVQFVINSFSGTLILDADALNCIAKNTQMLKNAKCDIIITPHPGEMARLTGKAIAEIQADRVKTAADFATEYGVTVLLKGADTVVADKNGKVYINTTGNPSMARGGSGDVLTGLIAGLVPQTDDAFTAACSACYIHGGTGDYLAEKYGILSATPSRLIENIHNYLSE